MFCESEADIVIYGGEAGGGKTVAQLFEAARHVEDKNYTGVIFRRKYNEITDGGGLWDTSMDIYPHLGGVPTRGKTQWAWYKDKKEWSRVKFNHLNHEKDAYDHQGAAYVFLGFDELTHFSRFQFFYLLTRNRPPSGCNIRPYCRATCNADADSWVADIIQWWWNPETGYPIRERSGVLRYFTIENDEIRWVGKTWKHPKTKLGPRSLTFIAARLSDNNLMAHRDVYEAGLDAQDSVTRERLKEGNWLISYVGNMFRGEWFQIVDYAPTGIRLVRYWDFAASEVKEQDKKDPDWTAGALCGIYCNTLYIIDVVAFRETPGTAETKIRNIAVQDGTEVEVWWEEEKGSAGKWTSNYLAKVFEGFEAHPDPVSGSKVERAKPWSAWAEFGRVRLVRGDWNKKFIAQAGSFPEAKKDQIDAVSGCFKALVGAKKVLDRYLPDHCKVFAREKDDFEKVQKHNIEVYLSLWADKLGGVYGGCYIWSLVSGRLRLYNEIYMDHATPVELFREITEKLIVPITSNVGWITLTKAIGNDEFFTESNENIAKVMQRRGIKVRPQRSYDESAAILKINEMFAKDRIVVHSECVESDIQIKGWMYDGKKVVDGFPMARALCLLVNELRATGKMTEKGMPRPYTQGKVKIREQLKSQGLHHGIKPIDQNKQFEYLTR